MGSDVKLAAVQDLKRLGPRQGSEAYALCFRAATDLTGELFGSRELAIDALASVAPRFDEPTIAFFAGLISHRSPGIRSAVLQSLLTMVEHDVAWAISAIVAGAGDAMCSSQSRFFKEALLKVAQKDSHVAGLEIRNQIIARRETEPRKTVMLLDIFGLVAGRGNQLAEGMVLELLQNPVLVGERVQRAVVDSDLAVDALLVLLQDTVVNIRTSALESLRKLSRKPDTRIIHSVADCLGDVFSETRKAARDLLCDLALGSRKTVLLASIPFLSHPSMVTRFEAMKVVSQIVKFADKRAVLELRRCLDDTTLRKMAQEALDRIRDRDQ